MNYGRLALLRSPPPSWTESTGSSCTAISSSGEFAKYPAIYRSSETQTQYLPLMFAGISVRHARRELPVRQGLRRRERPAGRHAVRRADWPRHGGIRRPASTTRS